MAFLKASLAVAGISSFRYLLEYTSQLKFPRNRFSSKMVSRAVRLGASEESSALCHFPLKTSGYRNLGRRFRIWFQASPPKIWLLGELNNLLALDQDIVITSIGAMSRGTHASTEHDEYLRISNPTVTLGSCSIGDLKRHQAYNYEQGNNPSLYRQDFI